MDTIAIRNNQELVAALEAGYTAEQLELAIDYDEAAIAEARRAGFEEGFRLVEEAAVLAERKRVMDLTSLAGCERIGGMKRCSREELQAAIDDGVTIEAFALTLLNRERSRYLIN